MIHMKMQTESQINEQDNKALVSSYRIMHTGNPVFTMGSPFHEEVEEAEASRLYIEFTDMFIMPQTLKDMKQLNKLSFLYQENHTPRKIEVIIQEILGFYLPSYSELDQLIESYFMGQTIIDDSQRLHLHSLGFRVKGREL